MSNTWPEFLINVNQNWGSFKLRISEQTKTWRYPSKLKFLISIRSDSKRSWWNSSLNWLSWIWKLKQKTHEIHEKVIDCWYILVEEWKFQLWINKQWLAFLVFNFQLCNLWVIFREKYSTEGSLREQNSQGLCLMAYLKRSLRWYCKKFSSVVFFKEAKR